MSEFASIPLDMEIIVSVAYRFRGWGLAESHSFIEKYRVRTPSEIVHATEEVEEAIWRGTLQSIHEASHRADRHDGDVRP